jgi:hypothetical protein
MGIAVQPSLSPFILPFRSAQDFEFISLSCSSAAPWPARLLFFLDLLPEFLEGKPVDCLLYLWVSVPRFHHRFYE